jgi:hypothetical protein
MHFRCVIAFVVVCAACCAGSLRAEHPSAPKLLPERTVVMVRIRDFPASREKFGATALGRIASDPQVAPLLGKFYEQAQEAYGRVEERVGVPLNRLLELPQGEAWFAVVPPQQNGRIGLALLLDVGDQLPTATQLLTRGEELLRESGGSKVEETIANTKVNIFVPAGTTPPQRETKRDEDSGRETTQLVVGNGSIVQFERDGVIVLANTAALAEEIVTAWDGNAPATLAQNDKFSAIMSRCQSSKDPPEFEWFVDPIELVKALARGNAAAQTGLALLPAMGVDGVRGVGGTLTLASGEFDSVGHAHLLLENPKSGVLNLVQMSSGDSSPEGWVPHDVSSYMTLHWDVAATYAEGTKLYDSFFGDGKAGEEIKARVERALGIDFQTELLPALEGRFTLATWNEPPARVNSQSNAVGIKLTDAKVFQATLEKIMAKYPERLEKKSFGSNTYYQLMPRNRDEANEETAQTIRRPEPCFALLGDYLLVTDSRQFFERCVTALSTGKTLADELDFKLVASKIGRQVGGQKPGLVMFSRPEEAMRPLYEFAASEIAQQGLSRRAENNEFFKRLNTSLQAHPLPPFAVLAKYLAPSGAMVTQDETGLHYMTFTLKRK